MKMLSLKFITLGIAAAISGPVFAQKSQTTEQDQSGIKSSASEPVRSIRASELMGINVTSKEGESLGQVQDLIIDAESGNVELALIGKGFMAGLGERVIPLPWAAINIQSQKEFVLNVDGDLLKSAPAWSQAELEHPDYLIRIYKLYDIKPHLEMGGPGKSGQQSGTGGGSSSDDSPDYETNPDQLIEVQPDRSAPEPDR